MKKRFVRGFLLVAALLLVHPGLTSSQGCTYEGLHKCGLGQVCGSCPADGYLFYCGGIAYWYSGACCTCVE
jgi:hypothetical protein